MSGPVRITPGSFGLAAVNNADPTAREVLARFGFTAPRRADTPLSLPPSGEPLADLALVGAAARGLRRAGYEVDVAPELQLSDAGEQALEVLADLHGTLGELAALVGRISDLRELAGVAAQMVHGAHNPADATRELFLAAARSARSADSPWGEGAELTRWFEDGAETVTALQTRASSVAYLQPSAEHAARIGAARPLRGRPHRRRLPDQFGPTLDPAPTRSKESARVTDPTTPQAYARWLREIADRLDTHQGRPNRALLQALVADRGLVRLTHELAHDVRTDLDTWSQALRAEPAAGILQAFGAQVGLVEDRSFDFVEDAGPSMVTVEQMMADHPAAVNAAAARQTREQRLWEGPEVRGDERVYLFWPDGSAHAPVRGLAPAVHGDADPYGSPLFTREGAELIVADMLSDDVGFTAAFQPDGSLVYAWPREHDGEGGRAHVVPDDRGLYAIGGQWPWEYCRPGNSYLAPRAEAARITSRTPTPGGPSDCASRPTAAAPAPGRTR